MKILILEPSTVYLNILKNEVSPISSQIFLASHEEEAWAVLNVHKIDLVISALQLNSSTGFEFGKRIKTHLYMRDSISDLPDFIFLSSDPASHWEDEMASFPCLGLLPRTFNQGELRSKIISIINNLKRKPNANILLVDDSDLNRKFVSRFLIKHGFLVVEANDGAQALIRLGDYDKGIDLVLSDNYMRTMNGVELFEKMQKIEAYKSIPFILLTAEEDAVLADEWRNAGITSILQKPFSNESLLFELSKRLLSKK